RKGIVLTQKLADILHIKPGEKITVEVKEGRRYERKLPVVRLAEQYLGLGAYMSLASANRLVGEGQAISGAYLMVDEQREDALTQALQDRPGWQVSFRNNGPFHPLWIQPQKVCLL